MQDSFIGPLKAVIRVFDEFGLALTANVSIGLPGFVVLAIKESPAGNMRRPVTSGF